MIHATVSLILDYGMKKNITTERNRNSKAERS